MTEGPGHDPAAVGPQGPAPQSARRRPHRGLDRAIGIVLGLLLGVGIVTAFVFLGSEGTIDAPRIDNGAAHGGAQQAAGGGGKGREKKRRPETGPVPVVRVTGGAPPPSGPPRLDFKRGRQVRFRIETDIPVGIEIPGFGVSETIDSDATLSFKATRVGQFPVIVAASHIGVATLRIQR